MRVAWSRGAVADLSRLLEFLRHNSPSAAQRAGSVIGVAVRQLADLPHSGRPYPRDSQLRELLIPFGKHGYSLLYEVDGSVVRVIKLNTSAKPATDASSARLIAS